MLQSKIVAQIENMLRTETSEMHGINERILHGILGIADEAGELVKLAKSIIYYNAPEDRVNLKEEMGDVWWYFSLLIDELSKLEEKTPDEIFAQIMSMNKAKLKRRYPEEYSDLLAQDRKLAQERAALEKLE